MQGRNQFKSEVGGRKGQLWKVSFPMKRFHYFASEHQKNVLSKALWLLEGVICAFQGFAEWFKQHFAFAYPHIYFVRWCRISQFVNICYVPRFLPAKITRQTFFELRE